MTKFYCNNETERKSLYTDFVSDLRANEKIPYIYRPEEYIGQEVIKFCFSQHSGLDEKSQKKITNSWIEFLKTENLPLKEVQLCTITRQAVFDAVCEQRSIESLRIKALYCKDLSKIANLTNLKKLFIESAGSVVDLEPIATLQNLEVLILGGTKKVTDYSAVGKLKKLKVFGVCSYQTRDDVMNMESDGFIKNLQSLEYLDLSDVKIKNRVYLNSANVENFKFCRYREN